MSDGCLLAEHQADGVLLLTMNRPDLMNAVNMELVSALEDALAAAASDESVRVIILAGAGEKAFSAGYDIHEMTQLDRDGLLSMNVTRDPLMWNIANHPKPIIAAVHGIAFGAGALIAFSADMRVGCARTSFKVTAAKYGGSNATWTLPEIVGVAKAKEILLSGRAVGAEEALTIGLLNHVVAEDGVVKKAIEMGREIAHNPAPGVYWTKQLINDAIGRSFRDRFQSEMLVQTSTLRPPDPRTIFSEFKEKHADRRDGKVKD